MNLKTFLSVLLVYRSNFHVLHWMAKGKNFFTIHSKSEEYYQKMLEDADIIAEMLLRRYNKTVNYKEALDIIENDESHEFLLIDSETMYDSKDFQKYSQKMFNDILTCLEELLSSDTIKDDINVGIKSSLESMYDRYDLQCNYLLKRFGE